MSKHTTQKSTMKSRRKFCSSSLKNNTNRKEKAFCFYGVFSSSSGRRDPIKDCDLFGWKSVGVWISFMTDELKSTMGIRRKRYQFLNNWKSTDINIPISLRLPQWSNVLKFGPIPKVRPEELLEVKSQKCENRHEEKCLQDLR